MHQRAAPFGRQVGVGQGGVDERHQVVHPVPELSVGGAVGLGVVGGGRVPQVHRGVGKDAHPLRLRVGVDVEVHVLPQHPPALGEADAGVQHEGASVELVRHHRQQPVDPVFGLELDGVAGGQRRHAPPAVLGLRLLEVEQVEPGRGGVLVRPAKAVGVERVVVVHVQHVVAAGQSGGDVARAAGPAGVLDPLDPVVGPGGGDHLEPLQGVVRGTVVDQDHLEPVLRQGLGIEGGHHPVDAVAGAIGGHDDADQRGGLRHRQPFGVTVRLGLSISAPPDGPAHPGRHQRAVYPEVLPDPH